MTIKEIKKSLEAKGFFVSNGTTHVIAGKNPETDPRNGIIAMKFAVGIEIIDKKAIVNYSRNQIGKEKSFDNVKDLVDFIVEGYPFGPPL